MLRQSEIIAIAVSATIALLIAGFMISSTRKTPREETIINKKRVKETVDKNNEFSENYPNFLLGGSKLKSKSQICHPYPYLTTTNAFLLFAGVFIGYILSHFR